MAIRKKFLKSKPLCKVSFDFVASGSKNPVESVALAGSFSNWEPVPMRKVKGNYTRTVDLETGGKYEFRYLINGKVWENDEAADQYVPNGISGDNSVVAL
jgi:1,4-alpha-glucan branching enzyme